MRKVTVYCDTDESKDMSDQDKALFQEHLNALIDADNAAENACIGDTPDWYYYRLPVDSHAAIDIGEPEAAPEATPVKHAVMSAHCHCRVQRLRGMAGRFSVRTRLLNRYSVRTRLLHRHTESEARVESVLIQESTQASDNGAVSTTSSRRATNHSYRASKAWSNVG